MLKLFVTAICMLLPLAFARGEGALPDSVEAAIRIRSFSAFRADFNAFSSAILLEHYPDLPDVWLLSVLRQAGSESINRRGDVFIFHVRSENGNTSHVYVVSARSRDLFIDNLKLGRTSQSTPEGLLLLTPEESAGIQQRKIGLYSAGRYVAVSDNPEAVLKVADLLDGGGPARLFPTGSDGNVQILSRGRYLRDGLGGMLTWLEGIQMIVTFMIGTPEMIPVGQAYSDAILTAFESADLISMSVDFNTEDFTANIEFFPSPESPLGAFIETLQPATRDLLGLVGGTALFAAAGRVNQMADLLPYHTALSMHSHALTGKPERMLELETERMRRFSEVFDGHFAAALVAPDARSAASYVRIYEVDDGESAKENFIWEMSSFSDIAFKATRQQDEKIADKEVLVYQQAPVATSLPDMDMILIKRPTPATTTRAAFVDDLMILVTGDSSARVMKQLLDALEQKPRASVLNAATYSRTMQNMPSDIQGSVFFSLTELWYWSQAAGKPGFRDYESVQPAGGIGAVFQAGPETLKLRISIPTAELAAVRATLHGNDPLELLQLPD